MSASSNKRRGVVHSCKGNWRNVKTFRINHSETGIVPDPEARPVYKSTATTADIGLSAGATAAAAAVGLLHVDDTTLRATVTDAILGAAAEWAQNRGCRRVWDIDVAAAIGYAWTLDGAADFRRAHGLRAPSVAWPSRPSETPDASTPRGAVIDPATGRQAGTVATVAPDAPDA